MKRIVDVVAEMKNGHYIKCKRADVSTPKTSNIGQNEHSYECGHELFSHKIVQMSADLAQSNKGRSKLYIDPLRVPLYSPELDYLIYPLSREKNQHYAGKIPENTYFVVISRASKIIDVIAELKRGDFIKCDRTTKVPPDIDLDKGFRLGYLCGVLFFDLDHMRQTAEFAKAKSVDQNRLVFPKFYIDDSSDGFIYPLFPNGRFYGTVTGPTKYYIVMDLNFKIKYAAVKKSKLLSPCKESMRGNEAASSETDNFICGHANVEFNNETLLENVEYACKALGSNSRSYPAIYDGPAFKVHGPYVTWPIRNGSNRTGRKNSVPTPSYLPSPTKFRVVMNTKCRLAGVIALDGKNFYKCHRSSDSSIPGGESEMTITETPTLIRKKRIRT
ncbi:hypothetical protein EPUL_004894 [Erysiphe pulchra]|uniref:Uncharacterized protein n=1 Tax=Erysiphe pulchra TaxID=225359 RepID=A0A2S4PPG4_9PEZI|nr:hypothetical protein EPUL_004894 [Erysiphe pulchra]